MRRLSFLRALVLVPIMVVQVVAQTSATPAQAPAPAPLPFERQLRKTVTVIEAACRERDGHVSTIQGTGFFLAVADKRLGDTGQFGYLVTNRHMALCWDDDLKPRPVVSLIIRLNLKDGSSKQLTQQGNLPWILPADDSVDLALYPLGLDQKVFDYLTIPASVLATEDVIASKAISEGLKIIFSGFFYQFPGEKRMQPIIREGTLAMMPDEELLTTTRKKGKVYLGDVHIFHGNSGSPVFVDVAGIRNGSLVGGFDYRLLGVVSGLYTEDEHFKLTVVTTITGTVGANSGIAMIVPAALLKNLLDDPRVTAVREAVVAHLKQADNK